MRRALLGVLASVMVVAGVCLLGFAGWIYAAFGPNGVSSTSLGSIVSSSRSSAIVIDIDATQVQIPIVPVHGGTTLRLDSVTGEPLIAGSSDMDTVDAFIGSRETDVAYRTDGGWTLNHVSGASSATAWTSTPDWMVTGDSLDVGIINGQTVAIANASGATGVNVDASLQFSAPDAPTAALILAISGGVVTLAGAALAFSVIWLMRRRSDDVSA